jgi:hypothetical protein
MEIIESIIVKSHLILSTKLILVWNNQNQTTQLINQEILNSIYGRILKVA